VGIYDLRLIIYDLILKGRVITCDVVLKKSSIIKRKS